MKQIFFFSICATLISSVIPVFAVETNAQPIASIITNTAAVPTLRTNRTEDVERKMARFGGKHFDIIFEGDSIMNRWETTGKEMWNQRYAGIAADFGIEGDHV